jgi:probable H4MPT-linked C1 transfer pathway protein
MLLGLDIGGANLKASDGIAHSRSLPFAIWKHPERLTAALADLLQSWSNISAFAVTMTAELADCFATKAEGVSRILDAVDELAAGRTVDVWQTGGEFMAPAEAREFPRLVAAANWNALATWAGRMCNAGSSLLIDIGSTTTDIIPLQDGVPAAAGWTDVERLQSGELVYAGVRRTPLCALTDAVDLRGRRCRIAAEIFATTLDVALLTQLRAEEPENCETADGRPATRDAAHLRLAHQLCCDATELTLAEAEDVAKQFQQQLTARLGSALDAVVARQLAPIRSILLCGEGEFLARRLIQHHVGLPPAECHSLTDLLGPAHSTAACAFALAHLGRERLDA